ncbi:MAG: ketol-acid reductoisomerase [Wenzhouxiangellaceae bacterium]
MKLFTEDNLTHDALAGQAIAIIGYGSQGKAHANNLRDSGYKVIIGARAGGPSARQAEADGFATAPPAQAAAQAQLIAMLAPDMAQAAVFQQIEAELTSGKTLLFAHGFNIHYGIIQPPAAIDVIMIAPKGPGDLVRRQYQEGRGVPCLRAIHQDASGHAADRALSYAHGIGGTRGGVLDTTFAEETETDLFGEQAVLCGGTAELVINGFETLVEAGYQPEVAYFECLHELKLIVDLLHEGGLAKMYEFISDTATYGDLTSGPKVIDDSVRANMREVLEAIRNGRFARDWMLENQAGAPQFRRLLARRHEHSIEQVGRKLRGRMSWLRQGAGKAADTAPAGDGNPAEQAA